MRGKDVDITAVPRICPPRRAVTLPEITAVGFFQREYRRNQGRFTPMPSFLDPNGTIRDLATRPLQCGQRRRKSD